GKVRDAPPFENAADGETFPRANEPRGETWSRPPVDRIVDISPVYHELALSQIQGKRAGNFLGGRTRFLPSIFPAIDVACLLADSGPTPSPAGAVPTVAARRHRDSGACRARSP